MFVAPPAQWSVYCVLTLTPRVYNRRQASSFHLFKPQSHFRWALCHGQHLSLQRSPRSWLQRTAAPSCEDGGGHIRHRLLWGTARSRREPLRPQISKHKVCSKTFLLISVFSQIPFSDPRLRGSRVYQALQKRGKTKLRGPRPCMLSLVLPLLEKCTGLS